MTLSGSYNLVYSGLDLETGFGRYSCKRFSNVLVVIL